MKSRDGASILRIVFSTPASLSTGDKDSNFFFMVFLFRPSFYRVKLRTCMYSVENLLLFSLCLSLNSKIRDKIVLSKTSVFYFALRLVFVNIFFCARNI